MLADPRVGNMLQHVRDRLEIAGVIEITQSRFFLEHLLADRREFGPLDRRFLVVGRVIGLVEEQVAGELFKPVQGDHEARHPVRIRIAQPEMLDHPAPSDQKPGEFQWDKETDQIGDPPAVDDDHGKQPEGEHHRYGEVTPAAPTHATVHFADQDGAHEHADEIRRGKRQLDNSRGTSLLT